MRLCRLDGFKQRYRATLAGAGLAADDETALLDEAQHAYARSHGLHEALADARVAA